MSWLVILGIVVVVVALVPLSGITIRGARPAGRTHLMTAARICLVIMVILVLLGLVGVFR